MSIRAAIRAAPTKKLTSSAPHAGVRRSAPRGTSGLSARRTCHAKAAAATAAPRRYHRPRGENTSTLGSAVAKARITPPSATASSSAPTRSASTSTRPQPRRSRSGRGANQHHASSRTSATTVDGADRGEPAAVAGEGDEEPAPREVAHQARRAAGRRRSRRRTSRAAAGRRRGRAAVAGSRSGRSRGQGADRGGQDQPDGEVDGEDRPPVGHGEHGRAEERTEHRADLLDRRHDAQRDAAALDGVEVGDEREGGGHQAAAADALEEPAGDDARHVVGQRRDEGAQREEHQRHHQHRHPAAQVGDPADQREHRDVAEQEAADDRGGPLQLVDRHPDAGHHVGQRQHDDVRVGGGERDGDGRHRQEQPRRARHRAGAGRGLAHGAVISFSVP